MNVLKKSSKLIKPHTPTPQNLKLYKISMMDQFMAYMNIGVVLFYESGPKNKQMQELEESLSRILVKFYILAGRYREKDLSVDCNDDGAEFVEAEAETDLLSTTKKTDLNDLFPDRHLVVDDSADDPLLSIQATHFSCGGLAIAISVSHRVFDGSSLATFVAAWSNSCTTTPDSVLPLPTFNFPSLLPCMDLGEAVSSDKFIVEANEVTVRRLVFNNEALTKLKSEIFTNSNSNSNISRVRVVCAVISKALMRADRAKHGGDRSRSHVIVLPVNMRERTIPPQPKHSCGNLSMPSFTLVADDDVGIGELADAIKESVGKSIGNYARIFESPGIILHLFGKKKPQVHDAPKPSSFIFTDWSKFGFYEADFGWGKPVSTGIGPLHQKFTNTVLMNDREGHGIEAWLHFKTSDMPYLDQDEEINKFFITT